MGRSKIIQPSYCKCGAELHFKLKGRHRQFCPDCAAERIRVYHNKLRQKQWREDTEYRNTCLERMRNYRINQHKIKIETEQLKGTSEI